MFLNVSYLKVICMMLYKTHLSARLVRSCPGIVHGLECGQCEWEGLGFKVVRMLIISKTER